MGLSAIDFFVGPAEGTKASFNRPDKTVSRTLLRFTGMAAQGAFDADPRHDPVSVSDHVFIHWQAHIRLLDLLGFIKIPPNPFYRTILTEGCLQSAS